MAFGKHFHKDMLFQKISLYSCQGGIPDWNLIHLGGVEEKEAKACYFVIHLKAENTKNDHFELAQKFNHPLGTIDAEVRAEIRSRNPAKKIKLEPADQRVSWKLIE